MKAAITACCFLALVVRSSADDSKPVEKLISTSPNHRYELIAGGSAYPDGWKVFNGLEVRDKTTHTSIDLDDKVSVAGAYSTADTTAIWSRDSSMVALSNASMTKHGGEAHVVIELHNGTFSSYELPDEARPIRWSADGSLICSVRTEAPLYLNRDKKAFTKKPSNKTK
jgi:hypothetical protein